MAIICRYDPASPDIEDSSRPGDRGGEPDKLKHHLYASRGVQWIATGGGSGHDESLVSSGMRSFFIFLLIIGAIANAAIIGGVMTIIDEMNLQQREFYSNLNALNQYIKAEDVTNREMSWRGQVMPGREFCRRLRKFYIFKFHSAQQFHNLRSVLQNVSPDMRRVVADAMYGDVIRGCEVFRNASDDLVTATPSAWTSRCLPGATECTTWASPRYSVLDHQGTVMMPAKEGGHGLDLYRWAGSRSARRSSTGSAPRD